MMFKEIEAAILIQKRYRQRQLWQRLVTDPSYYAQLSNDRVGRAMFGKHIAYVPPRSPVLFSSSAPQVTQNSFFYHRESMKIKDQFNLLPEVENISNISTNRAGNARSLWRETQVTITPDDRLAQTMTAEGKRVLSDYAQTVEELLCSKEWFKLRKIVADKRFNFSLHAQELTSMIQRLFTESPLKHLEMQSDIYRHRLQYGIARLHLFLALLVNFHNQNHSKFSTIFEAIIHELSLLILDCVEIKQQPVISYQEFAKSVSDEMLGSRVRPGVLDISSENPHMVVSTYPANSGMHSHAIAAVLSRNLLGIPTSDDISFYPYGNDHYYETNNIRPQLLGLHENAAKARIHFFNGSVFDVFSPYTKGYSINETLEQLKKNKMLNLDEHHIVVIDITNTDYKKLILNSQMQDAINSGRLSVVLWESWQKYGLLGTDQAQFGRTIVLTGKIHQTKLEKMEQAAAIDISHIDMQIGALFQVSRQQHGAYQKINFHNGQLLRNIVADKGDDPELEKTGPFVGKFVNESAIGHLFDLFRKELAVERDSFGFNYVSYSNMRISVGSEPEIDITVYGYYLLLLCSCMIGEFPYKILEKEVYKSDTLQRIQDKVVEYFNSKILDFAYCSKEELINLLAHLQASNFLMNVVTFETIMPQLPVGSILNICNRFLRKLSHEEEKNIFQTHLQGSKKSIRLIIDVKHLIKEFQKKQAHMKSETRLPSPYDQISKISEEQQQNVLETFPSALPTPPPRLLQTQKKQ